MLRNYPKRLDLWSVYLDQEIRLGDLQRCRSLFERVTYLQLPPKKMKVTDLLSPTPPPPLRPFHWTFFPRHSMRERRNPDVLRPPGCPPLGALCSFPPQFFFKRYLDFEKSHGTAATVAHVKQRAMEFVEGIKAGE